ncbi:HNM1-Choline permease [Fusarium albosuccineum]|uniref:HNM1-Choline permease n=1 Tax=Fusarium albosuccineum TaxID=1237068 RepID=A0A8H4LKL1_9HYPO|nr:HNM1-Choline permease [Fusarium albosuccineum]
MEKQPMNQAERDALDLAAFGHAETLTRKFSMLSMLSLAFCVLGTWAVCAQGLATAIENGGPISCLWGLVLVTLCNTCIAMSLGELCSSMPTALGQAFWVSQLWRTPTGRFTSYMTAFTNWFGWLCLSASQTAFMAEFCLSMKLMFDPDWTDMDKGWVLFLVYTGINIFFTFVNYVGCRSEKFLPYFNNFVAVGFVGLFVTFCLALPISVGTKSTLEYQSAKFVFGTWVNETGWSDGVVWFLGLVQAAYALTAFDSVLHMVEELPAPRRNAPRTMVLAVVLGALSGFIFLVACLFCIQDLSAVLDPASGFPFIELVQSTIGLKRAAALIALFIFNGFGQGISVLTSASRLTWSFARDRGLPYGDYFSYVDPYWQVPGRSLILQGIIINLVGLLYLFSSTTLEAILSVSTIALTISYAIPIGVLLAVGRNKLPSGGEFGLGRFGPTLNVVSIIYAAITTVFFFFPGTPKPTPGDMNYAIAVFGIMLIIALGFWVVKGRKSFLQIEGLSEEVLYAQEQDIQPKTAEAWEKS